MKWNRELSGRLELPTLRLQGECTTCCATRAFHKTGHCIRNWTAWFLWKRNCLPKHIRMYCWTVFIGAGGRCRTYYTMGFNHVLYQLSYSSINIGVAVSIHRTDYGFHNFDNGVGPSSVPTLSVPIVLVTFNACLPIRIVLSVTRLLP